MKRIEEIGQLHEEIEISENEIVTRLKHIPLKYEDKIKNEMQIKHLQEIISTKAKKLEELYKDEDGIKLQEITTISQNGNITDQMYIFNQLIDSISTTSIQSVSHQNELTEIKETNTIDKNEQVYIPFSGEESNGKCLDLLQSYQKVLNILSSTTYKLDKFDQLKEKRIIDWAYTNYITEFYVFTNEKYKQLFHINSFEIMSNYINQIYTYLIEFIKKTKPLYQLDDHIQSIKKAITIELFNCNNSSI